MGRFLDKLRRTQQTRRDPKRLEELRRQVDRRDTIRAMETSEGWKALQLEIQILAQGFYATMMNSATSPAQAEQERFRLMGIHTMENALSRICEAGDNAEKQIKELDHDRDTRSRRGNGEQDRSVSGRDAGAVGLREEGFTIG